MGQSEDGDEDMAFRQGDFEVDASDDPSRETGAILPTPA